MQPSSDLTPGVSAARALLKRARLPAAASTAWLECRPDATGDYRRDADNFARGWRLGSDLLSRLPPKPARTAVESSAAELIGRTNRESRDRFLATHAEAVYRTLTKDYATHVRVERLVYDAATLLPGLAPTRDQVGAQSSLAQKDKEPIEIDQGILLSRLLAHPGAGAHLCHAMLLPRAEALDGLERYSRTGSLELAAATVRRRGKASFVTMRNPHFLNAEDETTLGDLETAIDVATLDPQSEIAVLHGDRLEHPKYRGRRVFSAGINLTHLYHGKISYVWYLERDMGLVNKIFRGLAKPEQSPDEICGETVEKPWVAAVDSFAIGGGCQLLLAMDYVLAASDAYLALPARKEGIIPGAANLRLWRFTGDRIARQAIMYGRRLDCDSPEGRLICDEVVPPEQMETALERVVEGFTGSGVVSAAGNRRSLRMAQEPLDLFRRYMAVYAREQAYCHFSPALIANLERHWNAQQRRP